jgi:RNA polymerase sigma-70 factor (ECF subfamily)
VQPERGRFRAFLLAAARHFLSNERDRERTIKRGGHLRVMSLDIAALDWDSGESRFLTEPVQDLTPERLFERQWALALLERVLMRMRDEYNTAGKSDLFETLQPFLSTDSGSANYMDAAATLEMTPEAARVAAHRFRKRYRQILKDEIANTVASPDDITDEIQHLFQALKS